jgi:hypothetical protein
MAQSSTSPQPFHDANSFDPSIMGGRLEAIRALVESGAADDARARIAELVAELRSTGEGAPAEGPPPEPWRLIAAHLKAAEVQIEQTHMAPAADSIAKAIYVATHESQISVEAPDPQLNV